MKFHIKDWAGNICFKGIEFDSFEDAWGYVYEHDPCSDEEAEKGFYDDYYVEETTNE